MNPKKLITNIADTMVLSGLFVLVYGLQTQYAGINTQIAIVTTGIFLMVYMDKTNVGNGLYGDYS